MMSLIGGNLQSIKSGKSIQLNDKLGVDGFIVKDSDGFIVARLDSQGNLHLKGRVQRTTTN